MNNRNRLFFIIFSILMVTNSIEINTGSSVEISIVLGPYPQDTCLSSTQIIWQTNIKTANNSVHYGLDENCSYTIFQNNYTDFHKILIDQLSPSKKYYYKIASDNMVSNIYNFYTSFQDNKSFEFIVYGDSRGVWDNWRNASLIAKAIQKEKPHFVLHTGDLVKDGQNISQWIDFFSISNFIHNCTFYPVVGNHEYNSESYFQYFPVSEDKYWYSFDKGPIHFIGLDSNKQNRFNPIQILWLLNNLMSNEKSFTIIFFHHPPFSSSSHGSTYPLRLLWVPLFSIFKVDIVFSGHDHCYEHGKVNDVNYIVTGGGGAPIYDVRGKWWSLNFEKSYHYCLVKMDQNVLSIVVKRVDGTVIDSFYLS